MMHSTQSYHTHALVPTERRSPGPPEVPTFQKAGIKGLVIEPWFGVFVPAGTAAAIVTRLNYP